jgi:Family of unknown function (DUF6662)
MLCIIAMKFRSGFVAAVLFCGWIAQSHGAVFAWTYTTDIASKGEVEFEQWVTASWKKEHGNYNAIDFREEFEYGVTDNFQIALYLNHHYVYANRDVPAEDSAHPANRLPGVYETGGEDVRASHNPAAPFDDYRFESVSFEAIYRLLNPTKDPIGLAMYFEPTLGDNEKEVEWKVILQKNWFEDRLVWALNLDYEVEFEKADNGYERDGVFEWFIGISYRFVRNWSAGLEFWNHHEFADATVHEHAAYFIGPTIHYAGERWWATLGFLHQLPIGQAFSHESKESLRTMVMFSVTSTKNTTSD